VLNDQRKVIFGQRNNIISSENVFEYTNNFLDEVIIKLKELKKSNLTKDNKSEQTIQIKSILGKSFEDNEINSVLDLNDQIFEKKIKDKFNFKRLEREKILGKEQALGLEKRILLQLIDQNWKSHIQYLEQLRGVIGLRSYGNRDPLIEYKKEAFSLFEGLLSKLKTDLITILMNLTIVEKATEEKESKPVKIDPKYIGKKMSRNEPCFCGSGKKYKRCCGAL
jgi:preprotein translocase subunit SecA